MTPEDAADSSADYTRGGAGEPTASRKKGLSRGKQLLFLAAAIILAFLVGFVWQNMRADRLENELETVRQDLTFERLETTLAHATINAQQGSFEEARRGASDFFTRLQRESSAAPEDARPALEDLLSQRDATITMLSRGEPESRQVLHDLYVGYRAALPSGDGAAEAGSPDAGGGGAPAPGSGEQTPR